MVIERSPCTKSVRSNVFSVDLCVLCDFLVTQREMPYFCTPGVTSCYLPVEDEQGELCGCVFGEFLHH